jgi:hypothetical protein
MRVFLLFLFLDFIVSADRRNFNECEKRAHPSLNANQKSELCKNYDLDYSIGPAVCSVAAKDKLHLQYKDLFKLCFLAESDGPVDCMLALPQNQRNSVGFRICAQAPSSLPADCYHEISSSKSFSGKSVDFMMDFCQHLQDISPLKCVKSAIEHTKLPALQVLPLCKLSVGSASVNHDDLMNFISSECIHQMAHYIQPSLGITAESIVRFCVEINPLHYLNNINSQTDAVKQHYQTSSVYCYGNLTQSAQNKTIFSNVQLSAKDRLEICSNAPFPLGPVNCTIETMKKSKVKEPFLRLTGEDLKNLCKHAENGQASECFLESNGIGNITTRATICNGAQNTGPANCYRKALSTFKDDEENRRLLCMGTTSEGPAACAAEGNRLSLSFFCCFNLFYFSAAPHYLVNEEKVHLCSDAPIDRYRDPIQCLQVIQSNSRNYQNAPKKSLGYFQENLQQEKEWTSRGLLISLCSFSDSQQPLASAECFRSSPHSLDHGRSFYLCVLFTLMFLLNQTMLRECARIFLPRRSFNIFSCAID